ncbi:hypothetical protein ACQ4PT_025885 [Festuca glaucescens]
MGMCRTHMLTSAWHIGSLGTGHPLIYKKGLKKFVRWYLEYCNPELAAKQKQHGSSDVRRLLFCPPPSSPFRPSPLDPMAWMLRYAAPPQTLAKAPARFDFSIPNRLLWTGVCSSPHAKSLDGRVFAGDPRAFSGHREVLAFLRAFAEESGIDRHVRLRAEVVFVVPPLDPHGEEGERWPWRSLMPSSSTTDTAPCPSCPSSQVNVWMHAEVQNSELSFQGNKHPQLNCSSATNTTTRGVGTCSCTSSHAGGVSFSLAERRVRLGVGLDGAGLTFTVHLIIP